ncbi:MAG: hypothetical protein N2509_01410 [Treponemataceae bacterium]|nr:hypothetical protein [Treponemataceae bacterium]
MNDHNRPWNHRKKQKQKNKQSPKTTEAPVSTKQPDKIRYDKQRGTLVERPQWVPPRLGQAKLPRFECPYCGKPIQDIMAALADRETGVPVHFDCVMERLRSMEFLSEGDVLSYIGGGRFGIVHYPEPTNTTKFTIKKIIQWEDKDSRPQWRKEICDNYSTT